MSSRDQFKFASEIARGEHDEELPDYDVLCQWIRRAPKTWGGGLLRHIVSKVSVEGFFKDDPAMLTFVQRSADIARDPHSMLRDQDQAHEQS